LLQRLDGFAVRRVVGTEIVDPAALGAEIVLHVDDDHGAALEVDGDVLWRGSDLDRDRLGGGRGHVDFARVGAPDVTGAWCAQWMQLVGHWSPQIRWSARKKA